MQIRPSASDRSWCSMLANTTSRSISRAATDSCGMPKRIHRRSSSCHFDRAAISPEYCTSISRSPRQLRRRPHSPRNDGHEADVKLEPGEHRLRVEARERPVYDEPVEIRAHETHAVRIRFPWRAQGLGVVLGLTTEFRGGQKMSGAGFALTAGLWSSRFHFTFDVGSMISNATDLDPSSGTPGRPWIADTLVYHLFGKPLWHGKLGAYRLALDIDPGVRFDEIRAVSYSGSATAATRPRRASGSGAHYRSRCRWMARTSTPRSRCGRSAASTTTRIPTTAPPTCRARPAGALSSRCWAAGDSSYRGWHTGESLSQHAEATWGTIVCASVNSVPCKSRAKRTSRQCRR